MTDAHPPDPRGEALLEELTWVHRMIRADLGTVRAMAADVLTGLPPQQVKADVERLATAGPLWSLRVNCLYYCRFVHSHHHGESYVLFPAVRASDPAMGPVVDRLEADHLAVNDDLDEIEAATDALVGEDTPAGRRRVSDALAGLADRLLVHLDYEEEQLGPVLRTWRGWPRG